VIFAAAIWKRVAAFFYVMAQPEKRHFVIRFFCFHWIFFIAEDADSGGK
jgi:hypothetical protein